MAENLPDTNVGNKEYIRKADAIDDLHTQLMYRMGSDDMKRRLDDWVKTLPSADVVQVRHAKDVYKQYNKHHCEFMCSLCGGWIGVIEGGDCDFNYCPNCGAKMDAQGEE